MPVFELIGLMLLGAVAWFWLDSLRTRDAAVRAARAACTGEGLQLLDDTVAIATARPARDDEGRLMLRRTYGFEYSDTGDNRRRGSVTLLGDRVVVLNLGPRPLPDAASEH